MTHEEWLKSLDGVGVSTSEAFAAGRDSYEAEIRQIWENCSFMIEFGPAVADLVLGEL